MTDQCVIVGGGIMGSAIALELARAGARPLVLEKAIPGAEASSAAAGILSPHAESLHLGAVMPLALASLEGYARWSDELRDAVGIDIGFRVTGVLEVTFAAERDQALAALAERSRQQAVAMEGLAVEVLDGAAARGLEPALSERVTGALRYPKDAQVEPRALLRALSQAASRAGARFVSRRLVRRVLVQEGRVRGVELEDETLQASQVVIAAGSWSARIPGLESILAEDAVKPARGQVAAVETRPALVRHVVFGPRGYLVPRPDGRVLMGSTLEQVGYEKAVTPAGLREVFDQALELVPALGPAPVVETWSGLRPFTPRGRPLLGPTKIEGLTLATGHFRNGILLAPITAELIRDHLLGRRGRFSLEPFAP